MKSSDNAGFAGIQPLVGETLTSRVYTQLRSALMEGFYPPGHGIKIRDLAASLHVSETPCREALMQLVRERGLVMRPGHSITVARLTVAQYLELRAIRMQLEGLAGEAAAKKIAAERIRELESVHKALVAAEKRGEWREAVRLNWVFHRTIYEAAEMPELLSIIEGIWLRNGPLLNLLYPDAKPTYAGRHQHLNLLDAMRARDAAGVRRAISDDMVEGGAELLALLRAHEGDAQGSVGGSTGAAAAPAAAAPSRRRTRGPDA